MPQPQTRPGDKSHERPGRGNSPPTRATPDQLRPASVRLQFRLERGDILRLNLPDNERHTALADLVLRNTAGLHALGRHQWLSARLQLSCSACCAFNKAVLVVERIFNRHIRTSGMSSIYANGAVLS